LAPAPTPKHDDKRAEQPIVADNPCVPRTIEPTTISLAALKWLSVDYPLFVALASASKAVPLGTEAWSDTSVDLKAVAAGGTWQQALTNEPVVVQGAPDAPVIRVGDALGSFPVGVLLQPSGPP